MRLEMPGTYAPRARAGLAARPSRPRKAASRPARAPSASALPRVRWDRLGRLAMLVVLFALLYLYLSAGLHMFSTWGQSRHDRTTVASMEREHRVLLREHESLARRGTVEAEARKLGMKRAGEQQYVIPNLPAN
jgi:hypothetical protein